MWLSINQFYLHGDISQWTSFLYLLFISMMSLGVLTLQLFTSGVRSDHISIFCRITAFTVVEVSCLGFRNRLCTLRIQCSMLVDLKSTSLRLRGIIRFGCEPYWLCILEKAPHLLELSCISI